ncbi:TPA: DJ-1/PfpI family protein [Staphylococcus aureus]|nr:DJ-1/PfpI family protein [Staphylococcus aureus]HEG7164502.1 DJ-1/PfpI family protein [Staphylococcus aureus]HEG7177842.1 DJ-1/PfpI family protein [Staphylococcus aureus]HEG7188490.1 DJ-1/PfpI family protein [Staphylococcus aureus]
MKNVYFYIIDGLADWEISNILAELNSKRFFKKDAQTINIEMVSNSKTPITTMGDINIKPECLIEEISISKDTFLILPGSDTWNDSKHLPVIKIAKEVLSNGGYVAAICGATISLADIGILNAYYHTSNDLLYLESFSSNYHGQKLYIDQPSVSHKNLITASSTGALMWTKDILHHLDVFKHSTLDAWFNYFSTGNSKYYFELQQTLNKDDN